MYRTLNFITVCCLAIFVAAVVGVKEEDCGYGDAYRAGYRDGYSGGYSDGKLAGHDAGYRAGYADGYRGPVHEYRGYDGQPRNDYFGLANTGNLHGNANLPNPETLKWLLTAYSNNFGPLSKQPENSGQPGVQDDSRSHFTDGTPFDYDADRGREIDFSYKYARPPPPVNHDVKGDE